jgi:hypothetical protein
MSEARTRRIRVYEIEHDGDLQNAVYEIRRCGASQIEVVSSDFDSEDAIISFVATDEVYDKVKNEADICL